MKSKKSTKKTSRAARLTPNTLIVAKVKDNPRREKTFGHKSMSIVLKAPRKTVTLEKYQQSGGRLKDLRWDLAAGHVKVIKKAA